MKIEEVRSLFKEWVKDFSGVQIKEEQFNKYENFDWWNLNDKTYFGCSTREWKNSGKLAYIVFYNNNGNKIAITLEQHTDDKDKPLSEDLTVIQQRFSKLFENSDIEKKYYRIKNLNEDFDNAFLEEVKGIITDEKFRKTAVICEIIHLDDERTKAIELNKMRAFLAEYADLRGWGKDNEDMQKNIDDAKIPLSKDEEKSMELIENDIKQIIFTGAPGTGKTRSAIRIANRMGGTIHNNKGENVKYELAQFHPSYDYTDFVEGLRPVVVNDGTNEMKFVKLDGTFKAFCRQVAKKNEELGENETPYFFIIDEINRADLSKVFGELMYCLEKDKRGKKNSIKTQYQNLPAYKVDKEGYAKPIQDKEIKNGNETEWVDRFADGLYIPENVVVIGTMNDIDRSVESMDFALRRRFTWKEFEVENKKDNLAAILNGMGYNDSVTAKLAENIIALNEIINSKEGKDFGLNKQYFISQGYFATLPKHIKNSTSPEDILDHAWKYHIKSLLNEYVRGENSKKVKEFKDNCHQTFTTVKKGN